MSAKQAINDKLEGSVATYLRCGEVFNNQIKKGLLLSLSVKIFFQIGEYLAKSQARVWLSHALCAPGQRAAKHEDDRLICILATPTANPKPLLTRHLSKKSLEVKAGSMESRARKASMG